MNRTRLTLKLLKALTTFKTHNRPAHEALLCFVICLHFLLSFCPTGAQANGPKPLKDSVLFDEQVSTGYGSNEKSGNRPDPSHMPVVNRADYPRDSAYANALLQKINRYQASKYHFAAYYRSIYLNLLQQQPALALSTSYDQLQNQVSYFISTNMPDSLGHYVVLWQQISQHNQLWEQYCLAGAYRLFYYNRYNKEQLAQPVIDSVYAVIQQYLPANSINLKGFYQQAGAYYHYTLRDYTRSLAAFRAANQCILSKAVLTLRDSSSIASNMNNIGVSFYERGDYQQAVAYYLEALRLKELINRHNPGRERLITTLGNMGLPLIYLSRYPEALQYVRAAYAITKTMDTYADTIVHITSCNNLAFAHSGLKQHDKALQFAEEALGLYQADNEETVITYWVLAKVLLAMGNLNEAKQYAQQGIALGHKLWGNESVYLSILYVLLAEVEQQFNQTSDALQYTQKGLNALTKADIGHDLTLNPAPLAVTNHVELLYALSNKVKLLSLWAEGLPTEDARKQYYATALNTVELLVHIMDSLRTGYVSEVSKQKMNDIHYEVFEEALAICQALYAIDHDRQYIEKALHFAEKSKSTLLINAIKEDEARLSQVIPEAELAKERELYYRMHHLAVRRKRIENENSNGFNKAQQAIYDEILKQQFAAKHAYEVFTDSLKQYYNEYYRILYGRQVLAIGQLQQSLQSSKKQAFIEYFQGNKQLYLFIVTKNDIEMRAVPLDKQFYAQHQQFLGAINQRYPHEAQQRVADSGYVTSAHYLYKALLQPVAEVTGGLPQALIVVPDGILTSIPFEALLTQAVTSNKVNFSSLPYVIKTTNVSYAYSAIVQNENNKSTFAKHAIRCLGMAPSYGNDQFNALAQRGGNLELTFNELEVKSISALFEGKYLYKAQAVKDSFLLHGAGYDVIHLAMHGILDNADAMNSNLLFATGNTSNMFEQRLFAYEVVGLDLKQTGMVVLSACQTGVGAYQRGEGVMSLARTFMFAGTPSLMMTLWKIQDRASADLMGKFYSNIKEGTSKDESLRAAKLEYIENEYEEFTHPYFWAGYVIIGNQQPLVKHPSKAILVMIGLAIITLAGIGWYMNSRGQNKVNEKAVALV